MVDLAPSYAASRRRDVRRARVRGAPASSVFCRRQPLGTFGLVLVLVMALAGLSAEWIAPYSPTSNDFAAMTEPPSWAHLAGHRPVRPGPVLPHHLRRAHRADRRLLLRDRRRHRRARARRGSAYFGGRLDLFLQRVFDVVMAFPLIIMALAVIAIFGTGVHNVIVAITIPLIPRCARVVRSSALSIREVPYIDAARACGFGHTRIILRHMVPNVMAPFLIMLTAFVGQAILAEASLSYLGLGVQEPTPAWGLMLQGGAEEYASTAPWIAIFPGLAIALTVFRLQSLRRRAARRHRPQAARSLNIIIARLPRRPDDVGAGFKPALPGHELRIATCSTSPHC